MSNQINLDFNQLIPKVKHLKDFNCLKGSSAKVKNFSSPKFAQKGDLAIAYNHHDIHLLSNKQISVLIIDKKLSKKKLTSFKHVYTCSELPAFQEIIIRNFCFKKRTPSHDFENHVTHIIHPSANIAKNCIIEPNVVIGKNVKVGKNTIIRANTVIEHDSFIGNDCDIQSQVFIGHSCIIKNNVSIKAGAKIGSTGFGFYQNRDKSHTHIPHVGNVVIENNCFIGANTCIDRAKLHSTHIHEGCKIDNMCQIAHNVIIGEHSILCAFTGISGSCELGKHVICGARVGIKDNIQIADEVMLAANSGVMQSITKKGVYGGSPCVEIKTFLKQSALLKKLVLNKNALFSK